ncbi:hypothetical protein YPPY48_1906, partial [Yersinia pestis PY-48]
MLITAARGNKE